MEAVKGGRTARVRWSQEPQERGTRSKERDVRYEMRIVRCEMQAARRDEPGDRGEDPRHKARERCGVCRRSRREERRRRRRRSSSSGSKWCSLVEVSRGTWAGQGRAAQARTMQGSSKSYRAGRAWRPTTNRAAGLLGCWTWWPVADGIKDWMVD